MKKNRCYPKYFYIISFVGAFMALVFALGPFFIKTDDKLYIKIIWTLTMFIFFIILLGIALNYMQYYEVKEGKITVKSFLRTIVSLDISNCFLTIQNLPTYSSWQRESCERWLCVYLKDGGVPLFKKGCNNKRKYKRIQIIYSEKNSIILSNHIKPLQNCLI